MYTSYAEQDAFDWRRQLEEWRVLAVREIYTNGCLGRSRYVVGWRIRAERRNCFDVLFREEKLALHAEGFIKRSRRKRNYKQDEDERNFDERMEKRFR